MQTVIEYTLPGAGTVRLEVFDIEGRLVNALFNGAQDAGSQRLTWNGKTGSGKDVPSGVYIYKLTYNADQGNPVTVRKQMHLVR